MNEHMNVCDYKAKHFPGMDILTSSVPFLFIPSQVFDKDGSGKVPLPEVLNVLSSLGEKLEASEAEKLVALLEMKAVSIFNCDISSLIRLVSGLTREKING